MQNLGRLKGLLLLVGGLCAAAAVGMGAYASHGLRALGDADAVRIAETAVRYQMFAAIGMIVAALLLDEPRNRRLGALAGLGQILGVALFSLPLYLSSISDWRFTTLAPLGGICFMVGWISVGLIGTKKLVGNR